MIRKQKSFDLAFTNEPLAPIELDEVTYMRLFGTAQPKAASMPARPLIDIVTPQPKAFFAYLQMPKPSAPAKSRTKKSPRIKRARKASL